MIAIKGVGRICGDKTLLAEVDLTIGRGESVAVTGPDAAGRAVLMRILATLMPPSSGHLLIADVDAVADAYRVRRLVAYAGRDTIRANRLRVAEYLRFVAAARRQPPASAGAAAAAVGLAADAPIETLSGALQHRLALAAALVTGAHVLLLDDVLSALDPQARVRTSEWLNRAREQGTTIVASADEGEDLADVCQRTVRLDAGRIVDASPRRAMSGFGRKRELVSV